VHLILNTLKENQLFMKHAKCTFVRTEVSYLGHVVSVMGIAMYQLQVQAVLNWPMPTTVCAVRTFLGLTGYYCRFIRDYGAITTPLTKLLRKGGFIQGPDAEDAFHNLQQALTTALVLQLPDFDKSFIVECNALGMGFGTVLHQGAGPVAYFSRPITARHAKLAAYERELIGLIHDVRHWHPYIWGRSFLIKINHYSLMFLLDQHLPTIPRHQWASKLLGFDFRVEFKPGMTNVLADALSHHDTEEAGVMVLSCPSFHLFDSLHQEVASTPDLHALLDEAANGTKGPS
jgi:hypothetical protein